MLWFLILITIFLLYLEIKNWILLFNKEGREQQEELIENSEGLYKVIDVNGLPIYVIYCLFISVYLANKLIIILSVIFLIIMLLIRERKYNKFHVTSLFETGYYMFLLYSLIGRLLLR